MRHLLPVLPLIVTVTGVLSAPRARPILDAAPAASRTIAATFAHAARVAVRTPIDSLRARIVARIAAQPGAEVAVWFEDLSHRDTMAIGADVTFHAASTMKVPVMIELFRRIGAGRSSLSDEIFLQNAFESIVDHSVYTLDPKDDSDSSLYTLVGQNVSLRELNEHMITTSSNLAANTLIQFLDPVQVTATAHALGARGMQVLRGVEDGKAFEKGLNNTTTARALGVLLAAIERGKAASRSGCDSMRAVLLRQKFHDEIPAGLPSGTPVAHKTGWITGTLHDAAIVYPRGRGPYVLVVLTRGINRPADAQALIADISRNVYFYATR